jgi:hypothetical protein
VLLIWDQKIEVYLTKQALTATVTPAPENKELQEAREIARRLREEYPGWKESLDPCPCTALEAKANPNFAGGLPSTAVELVY